MTPLLLADLESIVSSLTKSHVVFWVAVASVPIVPSVASLWFRYQSQESRLRTIRQLADQGHSADEIERLIGPEASDDSV